MHNHIVNMDPEQRRIMFQNKASKQLDDFMVAEYLQQKEEARLLKKSKEEENLKFEAVSK